MTHATSTVRRATAFTLHQATLLLGIVTLPLALLARRVGLVLPVGRLVEWANRAYDSHSERHGE